MLNIIITVLLLIINNCFNLFIFNIYDLDSIARNHFEWCWKLSIFSILVCSLWFAIFVFGKNKSNVYNKENIEKQFKYNGINTGTKHGVTFTLNPRYNAEYYDTLDKISQEQADKYNRREYLNYLEIVKLQDTSCINEVEAEFFNKLYPCYEIRKCDERIKSGDFLEERTQNNLFVLYIKYNLALKFNNETQSLELVNINEVSLNEQKELLFNILNKCGIEYCCCTGSILHGSYDHIHFEEDKNLKNYKDEVIPILGSQPRNTPMYLIKSKYEINTERIEYLKTKSNEILSNSKEVAIEGFELIKDLKFNSIEWYKFIKQLEFLNWKNKSVFDFKENGENIKVNIKNFGNEIFEKDLSQMINEYLSCDYEQLIKDSKFM